MISQEDIARVKGLGCLRDKTTKDCFNVRVITGNGKLGADKVRAIAEAAELYGNGEVAFTTRLTAEIQRVPFDNLNELFLFLKKNDLESGGTGPRVRPVVSCKGTTCVFGLIDTYSLSEKIHKRFYQGYHSVSLPHKFKIAVGGCPNNCVKPDLNDLGVVGYKAPTFSPDKCKGCKSCAVSISCPMNACKLYDGKATLDSALCTGCGRCFGKCPFGAFDGYTQGYKVYIGGRWGKSASRGIPLKAVFETEEQVLSIVEKTILLFKKHGVAGERLAQTVERLGFDKVEKILLSDELLNEKSAILGNA